MNKVSDVKAFIQELIKRYGSKSPKFFQVINWITGVFTVIVGVPALLADFHTQTGLSIDLPSWFPILEQIAKVTLGMLVVSKMTVQRATIPETKGIVEGATHEQLPFTAKKETAGVIHTDEPKI